MTVSRSRAVFEDSTCQRESKMHSEPRETHKMEPFTKVIKSF